MKEEEKEEEKMASNLDGAEAIKEQTEEPWDGKLKITSKELFANMEKMELQIRKHNKGDSELAKENRKLVETIDAFLKKVMYRE
jgi:predicted RNA-binding protein with PIN domain